MSAKSFMRKMPGCLEEPVLNLIYIKVMISIKEKFFPLWRRFVKRLFYIGYFCTTSAVGTGNERNNSHCIRKDPFGTLICWDVKIMKRTVHYRLFLYRQTTKHVQMMVIQLWCGSLFLSVNDYLIAQTKRTNTNTSQKPHAF